MSLLKTPVGCYLFSNDVDKAWVLSKERGWSFAQTIREMVKIGAEILETEEETRKRNTE